MKYEWNVRNATASLKLLRSTQEYFVCISLTFLFLNIKSGIYKKKKIGPIWRHDKKV